MARQAFDPMTILANNPFYLGAPGTPVPKWTTDSLGRRVRTQAFTDPKAVTPEALTGKAYGFTPDSNLGAQQVLDMAGGNQGLVGRPRSISEAWNQAQKQFSPGSQPVATPESTVAYSGMPQPPYGQAISANQSSGQPNSLYEPVSSTEPRSPSTGTTNTPPSVGVQFNPSASGGTKLPGNAPGARFPISASPAYTARSAGGNRMRNYRLSRPAGTPSGSNSIGVAFQKATIGR